MQNIIYRIFGTIFLPFLFGICGFLYGIYFPIESHRIYKNGTEKIKWYAIPGMILGMIVCSVGFGLCMFIFGFIFPWLNWPDGEFVYESIAI